MAAALADQLGHIGLAVSALGLKGCVSVSLLNRVQVGALDVFDDADLQHPQVVQLAHHDRHGAQARALGGARKAAGARLRGVGDQPRGGQCAVGEKASRINAGV